MAKKAQPLLYSCDIASLDEFLSELYKLTFSIDHPVTIDVGQAVVTIAPDENHSYHIMDVKPKKDEDS